MSLKLYGLRYSVYTRIARMVLAIKDVEYEICDVNPFDDPPDPVLMQVTPFQRVPVLDHDGFVLFETSAITRYLAMQFPGPDLVPLDTKVAARMEQVIAIIDAHGYWPMVRQVFVQSIFRPFVGQTTDKQELANGMQSAKVVLATLEDIAAEGLVLTPGRLTLADLHLAPMIGYFAMADSGQAMLDKCLHLSRWWQEIARHPAFIATDPGLATLAVDG